MEKTVKGIPYYVVPGRKLSGEAYAGTAKVNASDKRIDLLKELMRSTPAPIDFERVVVMKDSYAQTEGLPNILRRARFNADLFDRKKIYIDDNLLVGAMGGSLNAMYTYPEWQVGWMIEEKTIEKSKTPEDRAANQWAVDYFTSRALVNRVMEIQTKRYGDPKPYYDSAAVITFFDWPAGGGNLNYPRVYNEGLASMIKEAEEGMYHVQAGYAFGQQREVLLLRGSTDYHEGRCSLCQPLCCIGTRNGCQRKRCHP